jgi:hypothetical protein
MMKIAARLPVFARIFALNKREKFVISVILLSSGLFVFEFFGVNGLKFGLFLAVFTNFVLYLILRKDLKGAYSIPIFILPFLYTVSFGLFYLLFPARFLPKMIITVLYAFGLYSLFLTQNIFAVSSVKAINLLRSARIVLFVLTLIILFFLLNVVFRLYLPVFITPLLVFVLTYVLNIQSMWFYSMDKEKIPDMLLFGAAISLIITQMSAILIVWPVNSTIYSIFLTGMFYVFSGLSHSWIEGRLFKGILWEYVWVAFLSILILVSFSNWGI